jgi:hypothetical protein
MPAKLVWCLRNIAERVNSRTGIAAFRQRPPGLVQHAGHLLNPNNLRKKDCTDDDDYDTDLSTICVPDS